MIFKIVWYIFSLLTIVLILINTPTNQTMSFTVNPNQVFNFRSNRLSSQQLIGFTVFMFLLLTVLLLF